MNEYQKPYYIVFNAITDAVRELEKSNFGKAREILTQAQCDAEEAFVTFGENNEIEETYQKNN